MAAAKNYFGGMVTGKTFFKISVVTGCNDSTPHAVQAVLNSNPHYPTAASRELSSPSGEFFNSYSNTVPRPNFVRKLHQILTSKCQ
jgi:hypothetical protein